METLDKYLGLLPTIKNSPQAVASTELGNVPFNETTLTSIVLSHLPVAWRTQYALTHVLVPESLRAILVDLENIEKLFAEKANEAARANKAKVAATAKLAGEQVPRNGKQSHGGGPDKGTPKKGCTDKFCKWYKTVDEPFTTHNTTECLRFNADGSQKDRPNKPFDSAKKPWNKPGSGEPAQMAYLTEEMAKLKKRLKKSKKRSKKHARGSSDSDSDSGYDSGSSSTSGPVDKCLKIEQPSGSHLESTDTRPIKATKLALDTIQANEIVIENSKTGKVTAVVAILKVFGGNTRNSRSASPGKLLIKPNKKLNLKKKHLHRS